MSDLKDLFESFYSKFVLRDFFGKVIPGLVLLLATAVAVSAPYPVASYVQSMGLISAIAILGLSWLAGFTAQSVGEAVGLIRYYPRRNELGKTLTDRDAYKIRIESDRLAPDQRHQLERLVVIKEATGNGHVALLLAALILIADGLLEVVRAQADLSEWLWSEFLRAGPVFVFVVVAVVSLARMHWIHVQREWDWMQTMLTSKAETAMQPNQGLNPTAAADGRAAAG
jgi:hypothetical protein